MRVTTTCWQMGLWSTQAKAEDIVLKAARHWGSDSSVINNLVGEQGRTSLCVVLPSAWDSVDCDMLSTFYGEGSLIGDFAGYK